MTTIDKNYKLAGIFIALFVVINALFMANTTLFPFIDLPNHLAEATIYKYYETGNLLSQYYKPTPWYFPNSFHTVFCSLFPDVESGNRVFHILYIMLLQGATFLAIKQLNGNPWYGLLAILFTYNYNLSYGFVGFAISLPILILLFYSIVLYCQNGNLYLNIAIALLLVLLFLMHAQNALMGLMIYGAMMIYRYRQSFNRMAAHIMIIPLPLVIMIFTWWFTRAPETEESTFNYLKAYYASDYFQSIVLRFRIIVFDNFQLQEGLPGMLIASFFFICVLVPLFWLKPWRKSDRRLLTPETIYAGIFFLITLGCYLFAPDRLPGQTPIFQRFCTIVMLSFIIGASVLMNRVQRPWLRYFVGIIAVIYTLFWFEYIFSFNRENKKFNQELFAGMEPASKLAGLIYDNDYRGRKVYIHFPNYYIVWKKGIAASKIIDYRFGVVRRVAPESELPFYNELIAENHSYQPQYAYVDYLLVRGTAPVYDDQNVREFFLVRGTGPWKLYQKKAEQNPQ